MKKHTTKRALLSSALSLLLCVAMLIGTTFAWFTDSVTSSGNIIKSGTLDVTMEWADGKTDPDNTTWTDASTGAIFNYNLWEPGYTEVRHIKIANAGTLALKYQLNIVATGVVSELADVIDVYYMDPATQVANRTDLTEAKKIGTLTEVLAGLSVSGIGVLVPAGKEEGEYKSSETVTIALKMQESAGNEYQNMAIGSEFAVQLQATQLTYEEDSFGSDYDKNAPAWVGQIGSVPEAVDGVITINEPEELAALAVAVNAGQTYKDYTFKLEKDLNLNNQPWTPIGTDGAGFSATFDGQGHTIYNLNVNVKQTAGLFGYMLNGGNVKNLTVENAVVKAHDYAGAILGRGYTDVVNCHVKNVTVITTPYITDEGIYDGGAKAGGVVGQMLEGSNNEVKNCSATDVKIYAFRDLGGVVGMIHNNNQASGNTATNVTLGYLLCDDITEDENENAGAIYGRVQSSATVSPAKDSTENQNYTLVYAVYDVNSLTSLANYVNNGTNLFLDQTVVMIDDIDLKNETWTPIGKPGPKGTTDFSCSFRGTFDGQNHTVTNLKVSNDGFSGLFGLAYKANIKNVKVSGASIRSNRMTGTIIGQLYGNIENCHAEDIDIVVVPNATGDTYDNGDKVGGIVGWIGDNGNNRMLTGCTVTNATLKAYRDLGGIAGYVAYSTTISNNAVKNVKLTIDQKTNYYGTKDANANAIWGRNSVSSSDVGVTASNNKDEGVAIDIL